VKIARVLPVFSAAFAVLYLLAMYDNLALASYFPRLGQWLPLTVTDLPRSAGPGMYWYGWLATSFLGAAAISALAFALPAQGIAKVARAAAWAIPLGVMVVLVYILRGWFLR
jgi:hypothetical protein